jgi:hypothetical protein
LSGYPGRRFVRRSLRGSSMRLPERYFWEDWLAMLAEVQAEQVKKRNEQAEARRWGWQFERRLTRYERWVDRRKG